MLFQMADMVVNLLKLTNVSYDEKWQLGSVLLSVITYAGFIVLRPLTKVFDYLFIETD